MILTQHYLGCLSHASYLLGDKTTGRAVVVDPRRDVDIYLEEASAEGLTVERVIETHIHADFVGGHLELAARTGAVISYGAGADVGFPIERARSLLPGAMKRNEAKAFRRRLCGFPDVRSAMKSRGVFPRPAPNSITIGK